MEVNKNEENDQVEQIEDNYFENEDLMEATFMPQLHIKTSQNVIDLATSSYQEEAPADLGQAARVAKKQGIIEVVEADNGQEKALSIGSPFSEISVKDEKEEQEMKEEGKEAEQILLEDQTITTMQVEQVSGAVQQPLLPRLSESVATTM